MKFMLPRRLLSICLITGMCVMLTSCGGAHGKAKISEAKGKITKETVTKEISMQKPEENDNKEKQKILNISDIKEVPQGLSDDICQVLEYYVYGTRYNFKASLNLKKTNDLSDIKEKDIKNIAFVLVDGIEDPGNVAIKKKAKYTYNKGKIFITFSKKINRGISLETLDKGAFIQAVIISLNDGRNMMVPLVKKCKEKSIEYISITDTNTDNRNKINIAASKTLDKKYMAISVNEYDESEDIYDFAIDAGHGGSDVGAVHGPYYEKNLTLELSKMVAENLTKEGYKVLLTRDGTENDDEYSVYNSYDEDGRVTLCCNSRAKYALSIHFNSAPTGNVNSGLQIFCSNKADTDFASCLVEGIVNNTGAKTSGQEIDKRADGVYKRVFNQSDINELISLAASLGFKVYDVSLGDDYLYMIRELGGKITNAYVDGRSPEYPNKNVYLNSNIGIESCLCEMCYMSVEKDLYFYCSHKEEYAKGLSDGLINYVNQK